MWVVTVHINHKTRVVYNTNTILFILIVTGKEFRTSPYDCKQIQNSKRKQSRFAYQSQCKRAGLQWRSCPFHCLNPPCREELNSKRDCRFHHLRLVEAGPYSLCLIWSWAQTGDSANFCRGRSTSDCQSEPVSKSEKHNPGHFTDKGTLESDGSRNVGDCCVKGYLLPMSKICDASVPV